MRLVIDASAALVAFTTPMGASALQGHELFGPELLWSEFTAELHAALNRHEVSVQTAASARDALDGRVGRPDLGDVQRRAWTIADRLGWGRTYDAEYVAVAVALDCPLLTLDARLARGVAHLIRVLSPGDLGI